MNIEFRIDRAPFSVPEFELRARHGRSFLQPVIFSAIPENQVVPPGMLFDASVAQQLMDELWRNGIRPTEGSGSAGSLKATQDHLQDMRKIAMSRLKIDM